MLTHDQVYQFLAAAFAPSPPDAGLRLVTRLASDALGLPASRARIFLPDLHLLSHIDARRYPNNHFSLDAELRRFVAALVAFKNANPGELDVLQMGDLFDIWRSRTGGPKRKVDAITADYGEVMAGLFFGPPGGVRAGLLAGNHDYDLHNLAEWDAPRFWFLNDSPAGTPDVLVVHGDQFDFAENFFPNDLQAAVVRIFSHVTSGQHELDHEQQLMVLALNNDLPRGDQPIGDALVEFGAPAGAGTSFNVVRWIAGIGSVGKYFDSARCLALELKQRGRDIRLVVCGHSHDARIVVADRGDGVDFALMDCGAWMGQCRFGPSSNWRPSAQVGVLIGNDARIYQLL